MSKSLFFCSRGSYLWCVDRVGVEASQAAVCGGGESTKGVACAKLQGAGAAAVCQANWRCPRRRRTAANARININNSAAATTTTAGATTAAAVKPAAGTTTFQYWGWGPALCCRGNVGGGTLGQGAVA